MVSDFQRNILILHIPVDIDQVQALLGVRCLEILADQSPLDRGQVYRRIIGRRSILHGCVHHNLNLIDQFLKLIQFLQRSHRCLVFLVIVSYQKRRSHQHSNGCALGRNRVLLTGSGNTTHHLLSIAVLEELHHQTITGIEIVYIIDTGIVLIVIRLAHDAGKGRVG